MKTLLVIGSAPCLYADVEAALNWRPWAELMLVNGACTAIEHAEHVLAGHTVKSELFATARREKFPKARPWRLHANWARINEAPREQCPSVTDWWGGEMSTGATSIAKGARIGLALKYDEIIICGAPMDGSGYASTEAQVKHEHGCRRIGDVKNYRLGPKQNETHRTIARYRAKFKALAQTEFRNKVRSMSGYTRECLGTITEDFNDGYLGQIQRSAEIPARHSEVSKAVGLHRRGEIRSANEQGVGAR